MEKINQFSPQRFTLLMKRFIMFNLKTWLIGLGAISGIIIIVALLQAYFTQGVFSISPLVTLGHVLIFTGGFILTSMAYNEIHTPARSQFYLTLPATTAEKLFSHWFITSVVFVIGTYLLLSIVLLISSAISYVGWGTPLDVFNPFTQNNLEMMAIYLVLHSIFFLGALYFRKNNFLKTILSLFVIQMVISIIMTLVAYLLFGKAGFQTDMEMMSPNLESFATETFPLMMKILFFGVLAPFCLLVSYFRLKEREV